MCLRFRASISYYQARFQTSMTTTLKGISTNNYVLVCANRYQWQQVHLRNYSFLGCLFDLCLLRATSTKHYRNYPRQVAVWADGPGRTLYGRMEHEHYARSLLETIIQLPKASCVQQGASLAEVLRLQSSLCTPCLCTQCLSSQSASSTDSSSVVSNGGEGGPTSDATFRAQAKKHCCATSRWLERWTRWALAWWQMAHHERYTK